MAVYKAGAAVLGELHEKKGSVKSLVFASKYKNIKQLYALVVETLKYREVLHEIILETKLTRGTHLTNNEALVLAYDFLFGRGVQCGGRYKKIFQSRKSQLNSALALLKVKKKVKNNKDLIQQKDGTVVDLPKYLRINTILTSKEDAIEYFKRLGYVLITSRSRCILKKKEFMLDPDVQDLLVFAPKTDLHNDKLYKRGEIIFQDKASCLPAFVLSPKPGSHVIDACAAPGNKTSQMAAMMSNKGKIFAFDLSAQRMSVMDSLLLKAGILCCDTKVQDFLKVEHNDSRYRKVEDILLDPSCSGSGIVNRLNSLTDDSESNTVSRIEALANFQLNALLHALSFPQVKRVVYSTCSVNAAENEEVVFAALKQHPEYELTHIIPSWKNRGIQIAGFDEASKCIRCNPEQDLTNGFFVAMLQKKTGV